MSARKKATRDSILKSARKGPTTFPSVLFGDVTIRTLTARQRSELDELAMADREGARPKGFVAAHKAAAIVMAVIDPKTGEALFTENDTDELLELDTAPLDELYDAIAEFNGFGRSAAAKNAAPVSEAVKNSDGSRRS